MGTNFWDLVEKEKKKKFGYNSGLNISTPTGAFGELVKQSRLESSPYTALRDDDEDDIAPVSKRTITETEEVAPVRSATKEKSEQGFRGFSLTNPEGELLFPSDFTDKKDKESEKQGAADKTDKKKTDSKLTYLQQQFVDTYTNLLAAKKMPGQNYSVLGEVHFVSAMEEGEEKEKRKKALYKEIKSVISEQRKKTLTQPLDDGWQMGDLTSIAMEGLDRLFTVDEFNEKDLYSFLTNETRDADFWDVTLNSATRGYDNSIFGEETYKYMMGVSNERDAAKQILEGDTYQFAPSNGFEKAVSGAFELVGQQWRQWTNPRTLGMVGVAAGSAALAGQAGPQVLAPEEIVTVPGAAYLALKAGSALSSFEIEAGFAYNEMLEYGISEETARAIALGVGTANAGLEMIQLDELFDAYKATKSTGATKGIAKKIFDELAKRGVDVAKETAQEVAQEGVTMSGVEIGSLIDKGEHAYTWSEVGNRLWDTAKSSALSFGMLNLPAAAKNTYTITSDHVQANKLTADEQTVADKATEALIAQREQTYGRELTSKEKREARQEIRANLEHGGINIEMIEEVLGGEDYANFKAEKDKLLASDDFKAFVKASKEQENLSKLEKQLEKMKDAPGTVGNIKGYDALQSRIDAIKEGKALNGLKAKLAPEVSRITAMQQAMRSKVANQVNDSRLAESYREYARSQEKLDIDIDKYTNENARKTVQAIIDSGIGDNSNAFKHTVDFLAKIAADKKDIGFDLTNNERLKGTPYAFEGKTTNGYKLTDENGVTIVINKESPNALRTVVGHEFTHVLEGMGDLYTAVADSVLKFAETKEGIDNLNARIQEAERMYKGHTNTTAQKEVVADLIGEYVFTDYDFIMNLANTNHKGFMKLFDEVKYLARIAVAGSKEARELAKVKNNFERAYREYSGGDSNANGGTKLSLENGNKRKYNKRSRYNEVETLFMSWENGSAPVGEVKKFVRYGKTRYYEKTENGSVELSRSQYNERNGAYAEDIDRRAERRFGTTADYDESAQRGTLGYSDSYRDTAGDVFVFGQAVREKLRHDITGSVPSTLGYDSRADINQSEYNDEASGEPGASSITFSNDYQAIRNFMKEGDVGEEVDNKEDSGVRFSLSKPVEQTKDLVALHNLTAEKLLKSLELGGLPMPSIAVTKADIPHDNFGEITLIMGKDTIDPKANKKNVVYSADAWTPTFPQVEYEADSNVERQINKKLLDLATKVDDVFKHDIDMLRYGHEDNLNRYGGEEGLIRYAMDKYGFKAAYLEDQGKHIDKITKQEEVPKTYNSANEAKYQAIADILDVSSAEEIGKLNLKETVEQYGDQLEDIYPGMTKSAMRMSGIFRQVMAYMEDTSGEPVYRTVTDESAMRKAVDDAIDMEGFEAWTRKLFSGIVKDSGIYNNKDLFTPSGNRRSFKQTHLPFTLENIVKAMASQNGGNTKNVSGFNGIKTLRAGTAERFKSIEAMHEGKGRLQHLTQEEADKINDDLSARLYDIIKTIDNESGSHGESNPYIRFDTIGNILMEVSEGGKYNVADIQKVFAEYRRNISDDLAADIKQLLYDVTQMPVNIYEAKPERAVSFDEVGVFVIPRNADVKLKQELLNRGYSIAEYDPDVEGDRQKVVNQFEEYKFSLSNVGEQRGASSNALMYTRGYGYNRDSLAELSSLMEDIAPVREAENAAETAETEQNVPIAEDVAPVTDLFPDDLAPIDEELDTLIQQKEVLEIRMQEAISTEDMDAWTKVSAEYDSVMARIEELEQEAATMDADRLDSLSDSDVPPESVEWLERADTVPLTKKAATEIARDVRQKLGLSNKQMYDVHMLIEEYSNSEFPDREKLFNDLKEKFGTYTESEFDETVKDAKTYLRTNGLFVSDSIKKEIADYAYLMRKNRGRIRFSKEGTEVDVLYHELNSLYPHLFPDDVISPTDQFMQMVDVANMDAETTVEMDLPDEAIWEVADAVANGVTEYQQTQKEKVANKSSREGFNSLMKDADSYVPPEEDIAPVGVAPVASTEPSVDDIAPTIEDVKTEEKVAPAEADEPTTANERLMKKLSNYQNELAENQRLREQSNADYDSEIARLQAEYDAKKNKNTLGAHDLLRRIERVKRMKNNVDADYAKRISDLGKRIEKLNTKEAKTAAQRQTKMQQHTEKWKNLIGDTSTWKDMALGLSYKTKTLRRILRRVVRDANGNPDIALADRIYDELETKYDHNEALLKRESQKLKEVFQKLKLNHVEDTYAHMLGELRHNPETTLTPDVVKEYYNKHKGRIDVKKVNTAIDEARKTFDDLIVRVNAALREQGFKEIPYRKGYFPHFTNPKQGWFAKLINWKTIDTEVPTSIAGLTEAFEPQRSWQSFNKERKGDATDYSLYQGLDTYIHGALDWIYHIDDLQSRRALENHIRYVHSEEGVKARIDEIKANEDYDADEAQTLIDGVLAEADNPLSGLVRELMNRTNTLANKKAAGDRKMEDDTNRKIYSTMTNLNNRINANMVVGSFSSALTNFIPMVQSWHQVSPWFTVRGLGDFVRSVVKDDGMIEKSDFLTNRLIEEEALYQTGWDKVTDKAAFMMNVIDNITAQTVWRSKYLQNLKEGMSESQAIKDADQFAKNLMAGRSRGNMPTIFDEKNPLTKIFTAFQLEVANQYGYMFDDVVKDSKSPLRLVKGYATAFLGSYLYNAVYSSLVGRDAAFDPMGIIEDLLRDLGVGDDDDEEDEDNVKDALLGLGENIIQEVPFVGGLLGGGRIPLSSALPYGGDFKTIINDSVNGEFQVKELLKPLYYLALPVGGGQIKKSIEGLSMFSDEHPVAGSYTASGKLRFPVEDTLGNRVQAAMFGQYASQNARYYFDNDIAPLGEKQIEEYKDVDIPIRDYWEYRKGLKGKDTLGEKLAYIDSLDLPIRKQNILANNLSDRKEPINMADWDKYDGLQEYDYAKKYPEKYKFLEANGISVEDYQNFDDDTQDAYSWAYQNPEKFTLSKAVASDLMTYRKYASDLSDLKADKDAEGKSISGSRKAKVLDYINNLDADYGEKIILFKSEYPSDDTYNMEIVEYLNNRQDISYEEMVTILEELDFTVLEDGTVLWD